MNRKLLGGLMAAGLTAATLGALPLSAEAGTIAKASPAAATAAAQDSGRNLIKSKAPQLKISKYESFKLAQPVITGAKGLKYASYERTFKGLPVFGGDFVVASNQKGQIIGLSVAQTKKIGALSTTPTVQPAAATRAAKGTVDKVTRTGKASKVVYALGTPTLAWQVRVNGTHEDGDREIKDVYVSARTGKVLGERTRVHFGTGTGVTNGPKPVNIDTTQVSASSYSMKMTSIANTDCRNSSGGAALGTVITGTDDVWGNGTKTNESGCVDALFAIKTEHDMLVNWLGGTSMKNNATPTAWPVNIGFDDVNAFYCPPGLNEPGYCNGTEKVEIGHNQANTMNLSNLDVMAHEYGHGIDQNTPGGHSGGQSSEFVGDVFAALTEHYSNQSTQFDEPDYLIGEEVDLVGDGPIRNMYNPSAKGDPNCYSSSIPNTEVHAAAGPGNHWFYLLAEGNAPSGKPASPTCDGSTGHAGIGIQKAGKIFYNAMLLKTTSSSYLKYRTWTLQAAKNLYPGSCTEFNAVKAAWTAVSVPAQTADPTCSTSGNTVTVTNPGNKTGTVGTAASLQLTGSSSGGGALTWTATGLPTGLSINATTGLISGTPTTAGTFNVTATGKDSTNATGSTSFTWTISGGGGGGTVLTNGVAKTGISGAAGSSQVFTLVVPAGATGLKFVTTGGTGDADLYVKFGSAPTTTSYDCRSYTSTNAETCNIATAQAGTYHVLVSGYSAFSGLSLTGSYTGGGGGTCSPQTNGTDVAIADNATVESSVTIAGCTGNASATAKVAVNIQHTYIGDLKVDLVAPDGSVYVLHNRTGSGTDNINQTYTVNLSSEAANGTWKLRVNDNAAQDTGKIDTWTLTP